MAYSFYIYYTGTVVVPRRGGIVLCVRKEEFWLYQQKRKRFNNHNMALMLVEILYSKNQINEATYRKIMRKYHIQNRIA